MKFIAEMSRTYRFVIEAESEEQAQEWLQTHDLEDVSAETSAYDVEWNDSVIGYAEDDDITGITI